MKTNFQKLTTFFTVFMFFCFGFLGAASKNTPPKPAKEKNVITQQAPAQERVKKTNDEEKNVIRDADNDEDETFLAHRGQALPEETFDFIADTEDDDVID